MKFAPVNSSWQWLSSISTSSSSLLIICQFVNNTHSSSSSSSSSSATVIATTAPHCQPQTVMYLYAIKCLNSTESHGQWVACRQFCWDTWPVVVVSGMQLLRLRSAIRRHHPPQRAVLSQICCFGERKVVLSQILLDGAEPRDAGTTLKVKGQSHQTQLTRR